MEHRPKQSYTIPCSAKFLRDIRSLAAKEKTNIGDLARLAFFLFPLETIRTWQDPGGPPKHDRELVRVRSGPNAGKNMLRKPRIQVRLRGKYSAADIRTALDLALEMKKKNIFDLKNLSDRRWLMSPVKSKTLEKELATLKGNLSRLLFTPLEGGVKTRPDALYIFGLHIKSTPNKTTIAGRYKELASIYHPDTSCGSHTHMTQVNQAYQILKNDI